MKSKESKPKIDKSLWLTTKSERINYYVGDLGRTLEGLSSRVYDALSLFQEST